MEQKGSRVAYGLDVTRRPAKYSVSARQRRDRKYDQSQYSERMGLAEAAVLKDSESSQASDDRRDNVGLAKAIDR